MNDKQTKLLKPNNSEKNNDIRYDQNKEMKEENEMPKNLKFKDCTKMYLIQQDFLNKHFAILDGLANNQVDARANFLSILNHLIQYSQEIKQ